MRNFDFRRVKRSDLPMMRGWLEQPHVRAWWPGVEQRVGEMLRDIHNPDFNMLVVGLIDHPFAYIHDYDAHLFNEPQFANLPTGARVIATFVGDVAFMGQGHSSSYIDARVRELRRNYPIVAVGPNTKDTQAIAIYTQAGFRKRGLSAASSGNLIQVMTHL